METIIRDAYATARREEILAQPATPAVPSAPHALFVGGPQSGYGRGGDGGGRSRGRGGRRCGRGHTTHRSFGFGWQGSHGRPHWQTGLSQRWRRRRRRRYGFEGHCSCCGQWGHKKHDCIRNQSNGYVQPGANVAAPGYSCDSFAGWEETSWKDPWGDDRPWQGQQQQATPTSSAETQAYDMAYSDSYYPHLDAAIPTYSTVYSSTYASQLSPDSVPMQQQHQQQQRQQQRRHKVTPYGMAGGVIFEEEEEGDAASLVAVATAPGGRAPPAASVGRAAGQSVPLAGATSSPVTAVADSRSAPAASARGAARQREPLARGSSSPLADA